MDYEQRYKEEVVRATQLWECGDITREQLEYIFPELAESEDEGIRKGIVELVKQSDEILDKNNQKRMLAWLEKHKPIIDEEYEQGKKDVLWCIEQAIKNAKDENEMGTCWFAEKWLEKQEHKPAEWKQENVEELSDFENAMMHIGVSFFGENAGLDPNDTASIKEQAELLLELAPKTEWSEEDEANLNNIIWLCKNCINGSETTWIPSQATKIKHLIETIKERGLPQQKAIEWSEDDEEKFRDVIRLVEQGAPVQSIRDHYTNWLKLLKQRIGE